MYCGPTVLMSDFLVFLSAGESTSWSGRIYFLVLVPGLSAV